MKLRQNIDKLINSLPEKDKILGKKFFNEGEYQDLRDLVDSSIHRIKKNLKSTKIKVEYTDIDLDDLHTLRSEIDLYMIRIDLLNVEEEYNNYDE